ncbi:MAG: XRE family transcriptional regulator [Lachnospiraceae bacterium]|nr:XRE family transcriptional regulator [Lachnospiraceae bacterium]
MNKPTDDLYKELNQTLHIEEYLKENDKFLIDTTLSDYLCNKFDEMHISKSSVLKKADINEIYGYQILSGKRSPSRNKLLSICIGAGFSLEETNETLRIAEYSPLFPKLKRDSIIIFGLQNHYPIWKINESLYNNEVQPL